MALRAYDVLADCRNAIRDFADAGLTQFWRARWVGVVALLRAVGHVLHKVDGSSDPRVKAAIDAEFASLKQGRPNPPIFWQFIEDERNNVLKAYEFTMHLNIKLQPGAAWFNLRTGESGGEEPGPTAYGYFFKTGPFANRDPIEVCHEAVAFWEGQLARIEARI